MRVSGLVVVMGLVVDGCLPAPAPGPSAAVQAATPPGAIPIQPTGLLPHPGPLPAINVGKSGSMSVGWLFAGTPSDGADGFRVTLTPSVLENPAGNMIYWAFEGYFHDGSTWYMGLQPNGQYGQTALFSVFGKDTTPLAPACAAGADGGAGTHCHIHYPWELGRSYELIVRLARGDSQTMVWEGAVADLASGAVTVIGDFGVSAARGLMRAEGVTFAEFFKRPTPCAEEARSEVLVQQAFAFRSGQAFPGAVHSLNANSGCHPQFFGDGASFVYLDNGG